MLDFKFNDGGRLAAGYKSKTGDCFVRAYCILFDVEYKRACVELFDIKNPTVIDHYSKEIYKFFFTNNYLIKAKQPLGVYYSLSEAHEKYGNCIALVHKHAFAIINGCVNDTVDLRFAKRGGGERKALGVWFPQNSIKSIDF